MKLSRYLFVILSLALFSFTCEDDPIVEDNREEIIGAWTVVENSDAYGELSYQVYIAKDPSLTDGLKIENFQDLGNHIIAEARMIDYNITIPEQNLKENIVLKGSGSITTDYSSISLTYQVDEGDGHGFKNFTAELTEYTPPVKKQLLTQTK